MAISVLHSHSRIERELGFPKHMVLVDKEYGYLFEKYIPFKYRGVLYYKVPIMEFVENGGIFKM